MNVRIQNIMIGERKNSVSLKVKVFVIGAQKCATSWLYYCLNDHPEVVLPKNKVEHAYLGGHMFHQRGADWYFNRFPPVRGHHVAGEVAVDYMLDDKVPQQLLSYTNDPKFIALLRNPVDRLVSAYFWSVRRGQLPDQPIEQGISPLLEEPPGFPNRFENKYFDELVKRGFYGDQLEAYMDTFDPARFLIILYEEVKSNPRDVIERVYNHIGVEDDFLPSSLNSRPKKNSYSEMLMSIENNFMSSLKMGKIAGYVHKIVDALGWGEKNGLSQSTRTKLVDLFRPRIQKTEKVLRRVPQNNRVGNIDLTNKWT